MVLGWLLVGLVGAEAAIPTTREAVGLLQSDACPDVEGGVAPALVRTSAGLMVLRADGTYTFGCPSAWGSGEALVATDPLAEEIWYVANARVFSSINGGCSLDPVDLPDGLSAVDVMFWRDAFWILATSPDGGALLKWTGSDFLSLVTWDDGMRPSAMTPASAGSVLWVTSIEPRVRILRLDLTSGVSGDQPLPNLPASVEGADRADPVVADEDEAWFVLEKDGSEWTWHAQFIAGQASDVVTFTEMPEKVRSVYGPVKLNDEWWAVIDNKLAVSAQLDGQWDPLPESVTWTCLQHLGARVYACTVESLLAVEAIQANGKPRTSEAFSFLQVAEPDSTCATAECTQEYRTFVSDAGMINRIEPGVCPDGRTAADLNPGDCACGTGSPVSWGALLPLGLLLGSRRRR